MLQFMGLQRVGYDCGTEQQWLIHVDIWQKPTQHCKKNYLPIENKSKKKLLMS